MFSEGDSKGFSCSGKGPSAIQVIASKQSSEAFRIHDEGSDGIGWFRGRRV